MNKYRKILLVAFLLLLPWQTRYIFGDVLVGGEVSEYGRMSLYVFDVVLVLFLAASAHVFSREYWMRLWSDKIKRVSMMSIAAIVLLSFISVIWSVEPYVALAASLHLLGAGALFYVLLADKSISINLILGGLVVGMIVPSILGWVQTAMQSVGASSILGIAAQDPAALGTAVIETAEGRWLRAYGTFPHPNIFGGFLAIGLVAMLGLLARVKEKKSELVVWFAGAVMAGGLVMSASRTAWLAALLGLVVFWFGHRYLKHKDYLKRTRGALLLSLTVALIVAISLMPMLSTRFDQSNRLENISSSERTEQWSEAGKMVVASPSVFLLGSGVHNYTFALASMKPLQRVWAYQPVHDVPMLVFAELGLVGLVLLLVFVVSTDWYAHKNWKKSDALIALSLGTTVLVLSLLDHYLWTQASGVYLLAIFFALNIRLGTCKEQLA